MENKQRIISLGWVNATLFICVGLFLSLEKQALQIGWFALVFAILVLRWANYRFINKKAPHYRISPMAVLIIPVVFTVVLTIRDLMQEATPGDYKEVENGIRWTKSDRLRTQLSERADSALGRYGKLRVIDANQLRDLIFKETGMLYRGGAAETNEDAQASLMAVIRASQVEGSDK